jgi:hypothetical protein
VVAHLASKEPLELNILFTKFDGKSGQGIARETFGVICVPLRRAQYVEIPTSDRVDPGGYPS